MSIRAATLRLTSALVASIRRLGPAQRLYRDWFLAAAMNGGAARYRTSPPGTAARLRRKFRPGIFPVQCVHGGRGLRP